MNETVINSFAFFGAGCLVFILVCFIGGIIDSLKDKIRNWKHTYAYKHRFNKKPTAKCYCFDCKFYNRETRRCFRFHESTGRCMADVGFCCEAVPRKVGE